MSFKLRPPKTIANVVICLSKKSNNFYLDNSQNHILRSWKKCSSRQTRNLFPRGCVRENESRDIFDKAQYAKIDSREMSGKKSREN